MVQRQMLADGDTQTVPNQKDALIARFSQLSVKPTASQLENHMQSVVDYGSGEPFHNQEPTTIGSEDSSALYQACSDDSRTKNKVGGKTFVEALQHSGDDGSQNQFSQNQLSSASQMSSSEFSQVVSTNGFHDPAASSCVEPNFDRLLEPSSLNNGNNSEPSTTPGDSNSENGASLSNSGYLGRTSQFSNTTVIPQMMLYEFEIPQKMVGKFIGSSGRTINWFERKSGAALRLRKHPERSGYQICAVEGAEDAIDRALDSIAGRFPEVDLSQANLPKVNLNQPVIPTPELTSLYLPEMVDCSVVVSTLINAGHVFLQQPTHPTFHMLSRLNYCMNGVYTQTEMIIPQLPRPIEVGCICASPYQSGWFRAMVVNVNEDKDECDVRYVDYGGYTRIKACHLRQIRSDFIQLPMQAVECYLAGIAPLDGQESFSAEAGQQLETLLSCMLRARVVGRHETDQMPIVELYFQEQPGDPFRQVGRYLADMKLVKWTGSMTTSISGPVE